MEHKTKLLHVTPELLAVALHLPEGTTIEAVSDQIRFNQGVITFRISHPSFPPVSEGNLIPVANVLCRRSADGTVASEYYERIEATHRGDPQVFSKAKWQGEGF